MPADFKVALKSEVKRIMDEFSVPKSTAFVIWFAKTVLDLQEDEALEAASIDGANDKGIDLFYVDHEEGKVVIGQAKHNDNLNVNVKESHVSSLTSAIDWLSSPEALEKEGRTELAEAAKDYLAALDESYATELWFIYTAPKKNNIEKRIRVYNGNVDNTEKNRSIRHYYLDIIKDNWLESDGSDRRIDEASIPVVDGKAIEYSGQYGQSATVSIPARELADLYDEYGDGLFDRNVRLFLGARKGSVNSGIIETLNDPTQRGNFWAYNNGITIICDEYNLKAKSKKGEIIVKNFSIVNGCQTTVSISTTNGKLDDVSVLARVIAAPNEVVDDIITFNNSQNPIRPWDIASQDKTQRRLKSDFEQLSKPYIYLTRRGARPKKGLAKYRDSHGKLRQIRLDVMGQYSASFRGRPVLAYKNKGLIFTTYRDQVFPPDLDVKEALLHFICGEVCKESVRDDIRAGDEEVVRLLKKGGGLFVLAVMARVIDNRNGTTLLAKLDENRISSNNTLKRLEKYAAYSLQKYIGAVQDEAQNGDFNALIKSPEFFDRVVKRVNRQYKTDALAKSWIHEALPLLVN